MIKARYTFVLGIAIGASFYIIVHTQNKQALSEDMVKSLEANRRARDSKKRHTDKNLDQNHDQISNIDEEVIDQTEEDKKRLTFHQIAEANGPSKITESSYHCLYEDALTPYRHSPGLKLLEIGLGCGTSHGPGKDYDLWSTYFDDDAQIYFLTSHKKCGQQWLKDLEKKMGKGKSPKRVPILVYENPGNREGLKKLVADHGPWNIIVDDGSVQDKQTSFEELWPALSPGGLYVIEGLPNSIFRPNSSSSSSSTKVKGSEPKINQREYKKILNMIGETFVPSSVLKTGHGQTLEKIVCCRSICGLKKVKDI